jgi:hypothetical protein
MESDTANVGDLGAPDWLQAVLPAEEDARQVPFVWNEPAQRDRAWADRATMRPLGFV